MMPVKPLAPLLPGGRLGRHQVLLFHRVLARHDPMLPDELDVAQFDALVRHLSRNFTIIPLREAIRLARLRQLPAASLSITFDDGYADNYTCALPILEKHRAHATFFVASGFLEGGRMWNDTLIETARRLPEGDIQPPFAEVPGMFIQSDADRLQLAQSAIAHCKHLPPVQREQQVAAFAELQSQPLPDDLMMSHQQLRRLHASSYAEVGAHTVSHPILANCDTAQAAAEIRESVDALGRLLGESPRLFAYPNGKRGRDYLPEQAKLVADAGLEAAVATDWGVLDASTDVYQIPRFTPWARHPARFVFDLVRARWGLI